MFLKQDFYDLFIYLHNNSKSYVRDNKDKKSILMNFILECINNINLYQIKDILFRVEIVIRIDSVDLRYDVNLELQKPDIIYFLMDYGAKLIISTEIIKREYFLDGQGELKNIVI